ncbi:MAG: hypothetical protein HYX67_03345 [Candidatus Melainabacteria bacterium]|nr:hypothetical protein [Candidatus Melainabacteria bacterium]
MNKTKKPIANRLRKQMEKEIRISKNDKASPEIEKYGDELMAKELKAKYPRSPSTMKDQLKQIKKKIEIKKKKENKNVSKRTTPGKVPSDSSPAMPHKEGLRWIKTLTKQTLAQRTIQRRKGFKKK